MKIAKLNITPTQITRNGIIDNYYVVSDNYDFILNSAEDVTSAVNLKIFFDINRINFKEYIDSLMSFVDSVGFSFLDFNDKNIAASMFVVSKSDRDSMFTEQEQRQNAIIYQNLLHRHQEELTFVNRVDYYVNNNQSISGANSYIVYNEVSGDTISSTNFFSGGTPLETIIKSIVSTYSFSGGGGSLLPVFSDDYGVNKTYIGYGSEDACKILRVISSGTTYESLWAEDSEALNKMWSARTSYNYF
ncbi:MAG: hypothetical protein AABY15_04645 [Nanoarchaeota archaeon]